MATRNWFDQGGAAYARHRPDYPDALPAFLAEITPNAVTAVDAGCGNGQFTCQLADHFPAVIGLDPSADQIANAVAHPHIRYLCAPAEATGLPDGSANLVTAAQAAHWFDLPRFYAEVRRIAAPGAILALVSYGVPDVDDVLHERFHRFYWNEIGSYWPPERRLVETGYAGIDFPFPELAYPPMEIRREWTLADFRGYLTTWSALRKIEQAGREDIVSGFTNDLDQIWGNPEARRLVRWPITLRLGRI
jgi:SAM-dependent methyltransferase